VGRRRFGDFDAGYCDRLKLYRGKEGGGERSFVEQCGRFGVRQSLGDRRCGTLRGEGNPGSHLIEIGGGRRLRFHRLVWTEKESSKYVGVRKARKLCNESGEKGGCKVCKLDSGHSENKILWTRTEKTNITKDRRAGFSPSKKGRFNRGDLQGWG